MGLKDTSRWEVGWVRRCAHEFLRGTLGCVLTNQKSQFCELDFEEGWGQQPIWHLEGGSMKAKLSARELGRAQGMQGSAAA